MKLLRILALMVATLFLPQAAFAQTFGPLAGAVFGTGTKAVVVYLHGDVSRGGPANYHYNIAGTIASQNKSATAIALLRPGYSDGKGRKSRGNNHNRKDQYSAANNRLVGQTLASIKKALPSSKLIVIGHSGGAAQLGAVIGQRPGLVDTAILLSCPCHLKNWQDGHPNWNPNWTRSQSPHQFIGKISPKTKIIAITGSKDDNTFPSLAKNYIAAAKQRGLNASVLIAPGGDHNGNSALRSALYRVVKKEAR